MTRTTVIMLPEKVESKLREHYVRRKGDLTNTIVKALKLLFEKDGISNSSQPTPQINDDRREEIAK